MKVTAQRASGTSYTHRINIRHHQLTVDEPHDLGGADEGPSPQELLAASLASCTAITLEMYAKRKGWDIGAVEVECDYKLSPGETAPRFSLVVRVPPTCTKEQLQRLRVIAAKCPVHRALDRGVTLDEHVELISSATAVS